MIFGAMPSWLCSLNKGFNLDAILIWSGRRRTKRRIKGDEYEEEEESEERRLSRTKLKTVVKKFKEKKFLDWSKVCQWKTCDIVASSLHLTNQSSRVTGNSRKFKASYLFISFAI